MGVNTYYIGIEDGDTCMHSIHVKINILIAMLNKIKK